MVTQKMEQPSFVRGRLSAAWFRARKRNFAQVWFQ